jgi:hypothetical protein
MERYYDDNSGYAVNNPARMMANGVQVVQEGGNRTFTTPEQQTFDNEEMRGSMQQMLADNIGEYVVAEFLIGTERIMRKQGILYSVGVSYVTLYDDMVNNFIVCDIFSIKFVYFYYPGQRPNRNFNILPNSNGSMSSTNGMR